MKTFLFFLSLGFCFSAAEAAVTSFNALPPKLQNMKHQFKAINYTKNPAAKVNVVELSSFECGGCIGFHTVDFPVLKKKFIDTGKVNWVTIPYPIGGNTIKVLKLLDYVPQSKQQDFVDSVLTFIVFWDEKELDSRLIDMALKHGAKNVSANIFSPEEMKKLGPYVTELIEKADLNSTPTFYVNGAEVEGFVTADTLKQYLH